MTTSALHRSDTDGDAEHTSTGGAVGGGRIFAWLLILTGAAGLLAAWIITLDKNHILEYKAEGKVYSPGCSINPIVSCGSIMESDQAEAFGFPNPMLGLIAYGIVICVGVSLLAGARFPRWYWLTFNAGCLFGVVFCTWLQYQSLYDIGALCLWCCLAWAATIVMFCYVTGFNLKHGFLPAPDGLKRGLLEFHWVVPVLWMGAIAMLILTKWKSQLWA
ncbi:vitamin K epoxide reductase family protein [Streptomyces zagrosensis]|uniref:Putative membrane protein n=1 Tax=Streptomyces zagrosensis TaxID=1042984 RepID=A0A7W9UY55_9ACTN|nr:vitamin K epoxide reductase family protein [Streptomyces zagrosensis]MBB5935613.1 putative membrane protein [Streptomyces zagrosensis]